MQPTLSELESLAYQAGDILRQAYQARPGFGAHNQVDYKGEIDLVTETDHRSEAFILEYIRRHFPEHGIIAEESGAHDEGRRSLWYVDPLDGTVNFAHGIPIFAVSLAYVEDGLPQIGVVYDPIRDECFSAERGQGAWLNGEPIRVAAAQELGKSLVVTGFPYNIRTTTENNLDNYARFALRSQGVRRLGSAALDLCYVGAGRFDGYWELIIYPWDYAAGGLIAAEAGAVVTDVYGKPPEFTRPLSILAANPTIHPQMLGLLRE